MTLKHLELITYKTELIAMCFPLKCNISINDASFVTTYIEQIIVCIHVKSEGGEYFLY